MQTFLLLSHSLCEDKVILFIGKASWQKFANNRAAENCQCNCLEEEWS
jgi:hypothetical protein